MPIRELHGPYVLARGEVSAVVPSDRPGVYALGSERDGDFQVERVGKAIHDLPSHLEVFLGRYPSFQFLVCTSPADAYSLLCRLYHRYQPRDNVVHPKSKSSPPYDCPICAKNARKPKKAAATDA